MKNKLLLFTFSLLFLSFSGCSMAVKEVKLPVPPDVMVYIPEGWFLMGSTEKDGRVGMAVGVDELPQHKVYVNGFYIDLYETTSKDFKRFLDTTGWKTPRIWWEEEWIAMYPAPVDTHPM